MKALFSNKYIHTSLTLLLFVLVTGFNSGDTPCDQKTLKEKAKKLLEPYKYDLAKMTHIMYKDKPTMKEIEVPLFIGEKYRLVFNTEALPKNIVINLFNRDKDNAKRKLMFTTKDAGNKREFAFDYSFANKIFIDYDIPAGDSTAASGCVVFMLGYK